MAICGNISLFVAHLVGRGVGREKYLPPIDEECNISCLFSFVVKKKNVLWFFQSKFEIQHKLGRICCTSVCLSVLSFPPSFPGCLGRTRETFALRACEFALSYFHFVSPSLWLLFVVCYLFVFALGCFPFPYFLLGANAIRRQSLSSSSAEAAAAEAASSSWGRAQGCLVIHGWWYSRN